jgi:membrane-bound lytic murein transglycosylase A
MRDGRPPNLKEGLRGQLYQIKAWLFARWLYVTELFTKITATGVGRVSVVGFIIGFLSMLMFLPEHSTPPTPSSKILYTKVKSKPMKLKPVRFHDLPNWKQDDHLAAFNAFRISCRKYLNDKTRKPVRIDRKRFNLCKYALGVPINHKQSARLFFEQNFKPLRVLSSTSMLTGYYEPEIEGSRVRTAEFNIPVYRRPADLVSLINDKDRAAKNHQLTFMRRFNGRLEPFPTREAIERGALEGQGLELIYLRDQVDAFFMHIQGSARIRLQDGSVIRIGYAGKNGHPYSSIGQHLKHSYKFRGKQLKLEAVKNWLRQNDKLGRKVMWHNKSYIFFRELDAEQAKGGPLGAEGVNLTPRRSLAVDGSYHQLGLPIWLEVPSLNHHGERGFHQLMIGQDVGSAIKGPVRGDIFWGSGDVAGDVAGGTKHRGNFTLLLPR